MANNDSPLIGRYTLPNKHGIHVRTAAQIAECCESFDATITISTELAASDGTDMMRLMMLQASQGTELTIEVSGNQAKEALAALEQLITRGFDSLEE